MRWDLRVHSADAGNRLPPDASRPPGPDTTDGMFGAVLGRASKNGSDGSQTGDSTRLADAAEKLEGVILGQLLKQLRKTVPRNSLLGGGTAGRIYRQRLDQQYARLMARSTDLGLAERITDQYRIDHEI